MKFHAQTDRRNCGQIAVAVITGRPVEEIEGVVGHGHGSKTRELIAALYVYGFECGNRCKPVKSWNASALGIAQVHDPDRPGWHWVAVGDGQFWDGHSVRGPLPIEEYLELCRRTDCKVTSLLEVRRINV